MIKRFLPRGLMGRSLLIVLVPLILLQAVTFTIFYGGHLDFISRRLSFAIAGEIAHTIQLLDRYPRDRALTLSTALELFELPMRLIPDARLQRQPKVNLPGPMDDDLVAGQDFAGPPGEDLQEGGFAACQVDDAVGAGEFGSGDVEFERAEADRGLGLDRGLDAATEHGAQAQDEFVRFERLGEIVVGAGLEAGDAVFGRAAGGEEKDWQVGALGAQGVRERETGFSGHHDVEDQEIGLHDPEFIAGFGGMACGGNPESLLGQVAGEQSAETDVVVHHEHVGFFGHDWRPTGRSSMALVSSSMMPRMTRRKPSTEGAPASR